MRGDRGLGGDGEVLEQGVHAGGERFVVMVDEGEVGWFASSCWGADAGEDRGDDVLAEHEEGADGSGCVGWDVVAATSAGCLWIAGRGGAIWVLSTVWPDGFR